MQYQKVKSVSKQVRVRGESLSKTVLATMKTISDIVGATLGPGGSPVLIERFEHDLPPMVTKDGVTVFRSLGFEDPVKHCIMETARDAAGRTASEAGDGTTTATILAEAIVRLTNEYRTHHPLALPQKVVRRLERALYDNIEPLLKQLSIKADTTSETGRSMLHSVAKISANGDEELAKAVMQCFDLVGDEGNVTIVETSGPSHYEVEEIQGYPIGMGYEDSCAKFAPMFINDAGRQMSVLEDPAFVLYNGVISDIQAVLPLLFKIGKKYEAFLANEQEEFKRYTVVVVAAGFSEQVLATFGTGWASAGALKVFPLVIPKSHIANYQTQFLGDLAAVTGATIFDPISRPLDKGDIEDLGPGVVQTLPGANPEDADVILPGHFEAGRVRSTIVGRASGNGEPWMGALMDQVSVVEAQLEQNLGEVDRLFLQERLAKLTGGIAKLRVVGASNGELKEKRDRADDAVCAVRGAIKHGCLPGGGWALMKAVAALDSSDPVMREVLKPALMEPVYRLLANCGLTNDEAVIRLDPVLTAMKAGKVIVYDAQDDRHGEPVELGILDSTPAVLEAIRNSISIASLLGTLGGTVVFGRDIKLEHEEARATQDWIRNANVNEADERA